MSRSYDHSASASINQIIRFDIDPSATRYCYFSFFPLSFHERKEKTERETIEGTLQWFRAQLKTKFEEKLLEIRKNKTTELFHPSHLELTR